MTRMPGSCFKILSLNSVTLPGTVGELFESGDISYRAKAAVEAFCRAASLGGERSRFRYRYSSSSGPKNKTIRAQHRCMLKTENYSTCTRGHQQGPSALQKNSCTRRGALPRYIYRGIYPRIVPMCTVKGKKHYYFQTRFALQ